MSAQQGAMLGRRGLPVPASLIIAALIAVVGLSVAAQLMRESTSEIRPVVNPADLATSEGAIRERHEALGELDAVFVLNPADLATSGGAIRERHEALGKLDVGSFTEEP
jgi:hypothetical protein